MAYRCQGDGLVEEEVIQKYVPEKMLSRQLGQELKVN